jgi:anionic cell wall polymer biosynthesis LytR-Cps2A-Psr (LCP) family protein
LLNEVYEYGHSHPHLARGRNPGAQLLKRTYGHIIGLPVHYYVMVDMRSFRRIVEAIHGVRVCVRKSIPVPREQVAAGVIRPGCQRLSGRQALWYGRSRTDSDDYARMARQKCLIWALYKQADPMTLLRSFQQLAEVFKYSVNTDIPLDMLPSLMGLVGKIRGAGLHSIQFVPPLIRSAHPDYTRIRSLTAQALSKATDLPKAETLGQKCA